MSSSEYDLAQRVKHLEQYTNTLHMVLDNVVQRLRKVEACTGLDEEGIRQTLEWRGQIEVSLTKLMLDHNWYWQDLDDPTDRALGDATYKQILKLAEMLPVDAQMRCWNRVEIPTDLPLVWSEEVPTNREEPEPEKPSDQNEKDLVTSWKKSIESMNK